MKRLLILASLLLPALALAQGMNNGCNSRNASCVGRTLTLSAASGTNAITMPTGSFIKLGTPTWTDSGSTWIASSGIAATTTVFQGVGNKFTVFGTGSAQLEGTAADGASAVAVKLSSSTTYANATSKLVQVLNSTTEKAYFDKDGNAYVFAASGTGDPVPAIHKAQTGTATSMEFGRGAATAGVLAVTFSTAFSSAPKCVCVGESATTAGCTISTNATTTTVSFKFNASTETINWICIGAR